MYAISLKKKKKKKRKEKLLLDDDVLAKKKLYYCASQECDPKNLTISCLINSRITQGLVIVERFCERFCLKIL